MLDFLSFNFEPFAFNTTPYTHLYILNDAGFRYVYISGHVVRVVIFFHVFMGRDYIFSDIINQHFLTSLPSIFNGHYLKDLLKSLVGWHS